MMHTSLPKVFLLSLLSLSFSTAVMAADKKAEPAKDQKVESVVKQEADPKAPTGPLKDWIDAENALIDPLSDKDKESFFILRNKYSILRVVKVVERDISKAVDSCSKENPDMKSKMTERFKEWSSAVDPIVDTAKKQLDKDIESQKIVDVKKARNVLKLNDKAYEYGESKITKNPITSKESCEGLLASMDRTEDTMITLLRQTLLPEAVIRSKVEKEMAEKEKNTPPKKDFSKDAKTESGKK